MRGGGGGGLHRISEPPLEVVDLEREYEVQKMLGEGCFAQVLLATHRRTNTTVVLKAIHTEMTSLKDFYREFHYSYHLSPHPNILCVYPVLFRTGDYLVFAQEPAPLGDLAASVRAGGLSETLVKRVAQQLSSALDFLHTSQLVHRDIKLENVLVFAEDMSRVKLCDFGATAKSGALVSKVRCAWQSFIPPEVCEVVFNERYHCQPASDVWQLAVVLFVCLTGHPPWQTADGIADPRYSAFLRWHKRRTGRTPAPFGRFSPRLLRLFKRVFEHKPEHRARVTEFGKYLKDTWLTGSGAGTRGGKDTDNPCEDTDDSPSNKALKGFGLDTTLDQRVTARRVWEWVLSCDTQPEPTGDGL